MSHGAFGSRSGFGSGGVGGRGFGSGVGGRFSGGFGFSGRGFFSGRLAGGDGQGGGRGGDQGDDAHGYILQKGERGHESPQRSDNGTVRLPASEKLTRL